MDNPVDHFWSVKLERLKEVLEKNNFEVFLADRGQEARRLFLSTLVPQTGAKMVAWGGSNTVRQSGLYQALKEQTTFDFLDPFDRGLPLEQSLELRRRALLSDLFVTGTNAVTEAGQLVNLDRTGNRVAALSFGPKFVVVMIGRNKIVADIAGAMRRIKEFSAPVVARWIKAGTPCAQTGRCQECNAPDRVCNTWSIAEKSYPKGRVKVVLVNEELGF